MIRSKSPCFLIHPLLKDLENGVVERARQVPALALLRAEIPPQVPPVVDSNQLCLYDHHDPSARQYRWHPKANLPTAFFDTHLVAKFPRMYMKPTYTASLPRGRRRMDRIANGFVT